MSQERAHRPLDDTDYAIIDAIKELHEKWHGEPVSQLEVHYKIGMPTSTLHRRLCKLWGRKIVRWQPGMPDSLVLLRDPREPAKKENPIVTMSDWLASFKTGLELLDLDTYIRNALYRHAAFWSAFWNERIDKLDGDRAFSPPNIIYGDRNRDDGPLPFDEWVEWVATSPDAYHTLMDIRNIGTASAYRIILACVRHKYQCQ